MKKVKLLNGDNIKLLKTLPDNSIDSVVTDPPYALTPSKGAKAGFMGKLWDAEVPSVEFWSEVFRVLKPGGHVLSFGGTRTYHRMVVNIEDAGFEIRDQIQWLYGSGFPKSCNVSKQIDKKYGRIGYDLSEIKTKLKELYKSSGKTMAKIDDECGFKASGYLRIEHRDDDGWGEALPTLERWKIISNVIGCSANVFNEYKSYFEQAEREVVGKSKAGFLENNAVFELNNEGYGDYDLTKSKTKEGVEWEGWGSALKPANEPICLARKPLSEKSIAENVLKWRTGGINVDGCRVGTETIISRPGMKVGNFQGVDSNSKKQNDLITENEGRFPANLILDESAAEMLDEQSGIVSQGHWPKGSTKGFGEFGGGESIYEGVGPKDKTKSGASRFFYVAKVSKAERNMGLDGFEEKDKIGNLSDVVSDSKNKVKNNHPTLKPVNLMSYLCKLITPPNGIVLDPFMGSGSTGIAALLNDFRFVGMEMDNDYFKIAEARINQYEEYRKFIKK